MPTIRSCSCGSSPHREATSSDNRGKKCPLHVHGKIGWNKGAPRERYTPVARVTLPTEGVILIVPLQNPVLLQELFGHAGPCVRFFAFDFSLQGKSAGSIATEPPLDAGLPNARHSSFSGEKQDTHAMREPFPVKIAGTTVQAIPCPRSTLPCTSSQSKPRPGRPRRTGHHLIRAARGFVSCGETCRAKYYLSRPFRKYSVSTMPGPHWHSGCRGKKVKSGKMLHFSVFSGRRTGEWHRAPVAVRRFRRVPVWVPLPP